MADSSAVMYPPFEQRLRRQPGSHSVVGSLPVLFFGNLFSAQIASIGINPSDHEYLDRDGHELIGLARRFETLASLHAESRPLLSDTQCASAIAKMRRYFERRETVYRWFRSLDRVTQAMGYPYASGQVAHLDLIQEATTPTWSMLARTYHNDASALLAADEPFLRWQLATFPLRAVLCNGKTVFRHVCGLLDRPVDIDQIAQGTLARVHWYATYGHIGGRAITVAGWNIPLARPTGLGKDGEQALGRILTAYMEPPE